MKDGVIYLREILNCKYNPTLMHEAVHLLHFETPLLTRLFLDAVPLRRDPRIPYDDSRAKENRFRQHVLKQGVIRVRAAFDYNLDPTSSSVNKTLSHNGFSRHTESFDGLELSVWAIPSELREEGLWEKFCRLAIQKQNLPYILAQYVNQVEVHPNFKNTGSVKMPSNLSKGGKKVTEDIAWTAAEAFKLYTSPEPKLEILERILYHPKARKRVEIVSSFGLVEKDLVDCILH